MRRFGSLLLGTTLLLAGCAEVDGLLATRAAVPAPPRPPQVREGISPESAEIAAYYARVERGHRTRGLLRIDGGGPDVPFDADKLARTFMAVAFSREFTDIGPMLVRRETDSMLHRWESPVRFEPIFGASVEDTQRAEDRASIRRFAARLNRATGHPVSYVERGGNFRVLVLSEEERRVSGPLLRRLIPGIGPQEIDLIQNLDRESYCVVVAADPKDDGVLTKAVAIIRAELPPLLKLSCFHEELAQGLGLTNDSPEARPSIFNDDDEFGRLTAMDELMLGMLYDDRLRPGMDADTARPLVRDLARDRYDAGF